MCTLCEFRSAGPSPNWTASRAASPACSRTPLRAPPAGQPGRPRVTGPSTGCTSWPRRPAPSAPTPTWSPRCLTRCRSARSRARGRPRGPWPSRPIRTGCTASSRPVFYGPARNPPPSWPPAQQLQRTSDVPMKVRWDDGRTAPTSALNGDPPSKAQRWARTPAPPGPVHAMASGRKGGPGGRVSSIWLQARRRLVASSRSPRTRSSPTPSATARSNSTASRCVTMDARTPCSSGQRARWLGRRPGPRRRPVGRRGAGRARGGRQPVRPGRRCGPAARDVWVARRFPSRVAGRGGRSLPPCPAGRKAATAICG